MTQTECIVCIVFEVNDCVDFSVSSLLTLLMLHQFHKCLDGAQSTMDHSPIVSVSLQTDLLPSETGS